MTAILVFILTVLALISVHEYGHFLMARWLGVKVIRFSIGFGKPLFRWVGKDQVEYVIAILPLGGYVKFLDSQEGQVDAKDREQDFNQKPLLTRFLVVLAGPLTNFLFAVLAFWLIFTVGMQQARPLIGKVTPASIAAKAGIQANTQIVQINQHPVRDWQAVVLTLVQYMGEKGALTITTKDSHSKISNHVLLLKNWQVNGLNPDPLQSLGLSPYLPTVPAMIAQIEPNTAAAKSKLQLGDKIVEMDKKPINDWFTLLRYVQAKPNQYISLTILRHKKLHQLVIKVGEKRVSLFKTVGFLGVAPKIAAMPANLFVTVKYPFYSAWWPALKESGSLIKFNAVVLWKMIKGEISLRGLGGPITIYQTAHMAFMDGLLVYISFLGLISVMLAFVNLLPIPGLDGGYFIFYLAEFIYGKPLSESTQRTVIRIGFIFLILVMINATTNDVFRLFS